ncbi:hypothetical protein HNR50_000006 [Spirochaeta isovalerica]|uniref:PQ loop repeat protein n=1 Tax=Spirochaeta isovalerica TaxID=150 RepID=A0A841R3K3_9SPIO|nr:hypothetical protein [Spirochaeta isovalerica]
MISSIFEALMLICFGLAWPFSIYKSWTSRTNKGKSLFFLTVLFIGYLCGILFKITGNTDRILILYILNGSMVLTDIAIYFRNRKRDNRP